MSPRTARRGVTFAVSLGAAVGMAWSGYYLGAFGPSRAVKVRPFVLERQIVAYTAGAKGQVIRQETISRRSDGTLAMQLVPVAGGLDATGLRTLILPEGVIYHVADAEAIRTKKTMTTAEAQIYDNLIRPSKRASVLIEGGQPPPAKGNQDRAALKLGCGRRGEHKVGHDVMAGYPVQVWQKEFLGANQLLVRLAYYRAPGLGCVPVKEVFEERTPDGTYAVRWESVPLSLQGREPDAAAMSLGEAYRPVSPAEFKAATKWNNEAAANLMAFGTADPRASGVRPAPVSGKPDFNARWELDLARSHGPGNVKLPYSSYRMTLAHNEPFLDVVLEAARDNGHARVLRLALSTDGTAHAGRQSDGSAAWDGQTLVLRYGAGKPGHRVETVRRMSLSADGSTLYADTEVSDTKGPTAATEVWHKKLYPGSYRKLYPGQAR